MPLNTEIRSFKNNELVQPEGGWDWVSLNCFLTAALSETDAELQISDEYTVGEVEAEGRIVDFSWSPVYYFNVKNPLWHSGSYKLKEDHIYHVTDERTITLKKGYTLKMWRSHK